MTNLSVKDALLIGCALRLASRRWTEDSSLCGECSKVLADLFTARAVDAARLADEIESADSVILADDAI